MIRLVLCLFLVMIAFIGTSAQGEANSLKGTPIRDRIVTGGGFGMGFSSARDFFSVSPMVGYQLTARLLAGTGVTYRYTKYKIYTPAVTLNDYGLNPLVRFTVFKNVFLQTEYEYLNLERPISFTETTREPFTSFLAGAGFIQPLAKNVGLYAMALYNFSYKDPAYGEYSPYNSPIVLRAGINVGNFGF